MLSEFIQIVFEQSGATLFVYRSHQPFVYMKMEDDFRPASDESPSVRIGRLEIVVYHRASLDPCTGHVTTYQPIKMTVQLLRMEGVETAGNCPFRALFQKRLAEIAISVGEQLKEGLRSSLDELVIELPYDPYEAISEEELKRQPPLD